MLLAVEMVDVGSIRNRVLFAVDLNDFSSCKKHSPQHRLLIGYWVIWNLHFALRPGTFILSHMLNKSSIMGCQSCQMSTYTKSSSSISLSFFLVSSHLMMDLYSSVSYHASKALAFSSGETPFFGIFKINQMLDNFATYNHPIDPTNHFCKFDGRLICSTLNSLVLQREVSTTSLCSFQSWSFSAHRWTSPQSTEMLDPHLPCWLAIVALLIRFLCSVS